MSDFSDASGIRQVVRTVERIAKKNRIRNVKHITLEVGLLRSVCTVCL